MLNARERESSNQAQPTVLVVDDSASIRKLVELTLRRAGYAVVSASSGIAALAAVVEQQPDLILLDVMLDAMDGFQITRALRAHAEFRAIPIVILSGREAEADRDKGYAAGVSDYLTKPFQPDQLLLVVRQLLRLRELVVA
jgi:twitching motility two-component system response regulator PilG